MAKRPEPAPAGELDLASAPELSRALTSGEIVDLLQRANRDYLYWDKFKHLSMPKGVDPDDAWRLLKIIRGIGRRPTQVREKHLHEFSYVLTEELQRCLHVIDMQAGGPVTGAGVRMASVSWSDAGASALGGASHDRFLVSSLMEEAIASSQIEGASTTRKVAKDMLRAGRDPRDRPERMIINNYRTITRLRELRDAEITPDLLVQIQASMTEGTLDEPEDVGRIRPSDDIVVHDGVGNVLYVPPPAQSIPAELVRLCAYANSTDGTFEHPVIKAVVLHFWLAYLHPFADGNGRTARALFYLYMLKSGYWLFEFLSVSRVILNRRAQYDRAYLYSEADDCDLTYFLTFHLRAIEIALGDLWSYLAEKAEEDRAMVAVARKDQSLNHRQRALLGRAMSDADAVFTIESHRASHHVAYATARADLLEMADQGLLEKQKQGRAFVFLPASDLRKRLKAR